MSRSFLIAVLSSALVGCLGSYDEPPMTDPDPDPDPGPGGPSARELFDQNVKSVMKQRCEVCHRVGAPPTYPVFLGAGETEYYSSIETYTSATACPDGPCMISPPELSILITKGVHAGAEPGWWNGPEQGYVEAWLRKEVDERMLQPPVDPCLEDPTLPECGGDMTSNRPRNVEEALTRFAACMDYDLWLAGPGNDDAQDRYNLAIAWANTNEGLCNGCHNVASAAGYCPGGACLFTDSWMTFDAHRKSPSILKLVIPVSTAEGVDLLPANRYIEKGLEVDPDHPAFELRASCSQAISAYVQATLDRYHDYAQTCTPAVPPP